MTHVIEPAASGRSKCRGCKQAIAKGEYRFGEKLPNPFADGEMTLWFHVRCGAYRRPESFSEVLETHRSELGEVDRLDAIVAEGRAHHRLERICGIQRAASGRAKCRSCSEPIAKDAWRIVLEYFEEGALNPAGYIHLACSREYFGTASIVERLAHFGSDLTRDDLDDIKQRLE